MIETPSRRNQTSLIAAGGLFVLGVLQLLEVAF